MKIRITKDIWDYGGDHHPPALLARKGEVLHVLNIRAGAYEIARNGIFYVEHSECEVIGSSPESKC